MMHLSKRIIFGTKHLIPQQILVTRSIVTKVREGVHSFEPNLSRDTLKYYERPTPIIYISGECLPAEM